jgi:hypothetical protein
MASEEDYYTRVRRLLEEMGAMSREDEAAHREWQRRLDRFMESRWADDLFLTSNLSPKRTGLPFVVWVSARGPARHGLLIALSRTLAARDFITVSLESGIRVLDGTLSESELSLLERWVELNRDVLVRFWIGDIESSEDLLSALKPV